MRTAIIIASLLVAGCSIERLPRHESSADRPADFASDSGPPDPGPVRMDIPYDDSHTWWYGTPGVVAGGSVDILDVLRLIADPRRALDLTVKKPGRWGKYDVDEVMKIVERRGIPACVDFDRRKR